MSGVNLHLTSTTKRCTRSKASPTNGIFSELTRANCSAAIRHSVRLVSLLQKDHCSSSSTWDRLVKSEIRVSIREGSLCKSQSARTWAFLGGGRVRGLMDVYGIAHSTFYVSVRRVINAILESHVVGVDITELRSDAFWLLL